jgi:hypothetical protein
MDNGTAFILSLTVSWFWVMLGACKMGALLDSSMEDC